MTVEQLEEEGTDYTLDPQTGGCDVQTRAKLEKDCSLVKDANGDTTVIDFPITFMFGDPNNGQIELDASTVAWQAIADWPPPPMPTCTTLHVLKLTIKDPDGLPFAMIGGSTRAKDE